MFSRFDTIPACDGQTDGRTDVQAIAITCFSIADACKMISITKMKSDSASTASGVGTCSDKINLQLHKRIVDLRDRPRLSKRVEYDNALKFWAQQRPVYSELSDLSEDLKACPAGCISDMWQLVFLVCGVLLAAEIA